MPLVGAHAYFSAEFIYLLSEPSGLRNRNSHSSLLHQSQHLPSLHSSPHPPPSSTNTMVENAPGQADRSVQVKLVLLGMSSQNQLYYHAPMFHTNVFTSLTDPPGEAAVGKSSVVLRFVRLSARSGILGFVCSSAPPRSPGLE